MGPSVVPGSLGAVPSFAGRAVDYGGFRPVPELIEAQADRHPGRVAACYAGRTLTYRQLDELANGLASVAAGRGVGKGDPVAVVLVNSLEMPVAYLALMKLGAVFVPLDPAWPGERLGTTLRVLAPRLIFCAAADAVPQEFRHAAAVVRVDRIVPSPLRPAVALRPEDLIYGFFTSGTTGTPKCAMNRQAGLANRLRFMSSYFGATGDEIVLQNSKHTFDSSLWQLCWPLTTGGRTVLPAAGEFLNLQHTIDTIDEYAITATDFVSSIFNVLVAIVDGDERAQRKLSSLRHLVVGSEEINAPAVQRFRAMLPHVRVTNGYGPTETAIGMVFHPVSDADGDSIPLGRPIDNCYVAVLGEAGRPLPRGTIGEIAIGGSCMGDGYHGDPAATAKVFVRNQFPDQIPGERLYLSGDLGYLDDQGRLFFSGRKDFQVKVGGVRIELGEIELAAQRCPGVRQAKALVVQDAAGKALALFASGDDGLTDLALRGHLRRALPRTSMPRHCLVLPEMPLSDGGKVNWRELRAMLDAANDSSAAQLADTAPSTTLADQVVRAFRRALGQPGLAADAHFMHAGGDSIQALHAVRSLAAECGLDVGVQDLFDHPTAEQMAALIEGRLSAADAAEAQVALMESDAVVGDDEPILAADPAGPLRAVLVTGATGFVGSRLVHELLARTDLRVLCLARAQDDAEATGRVITALATRGLWEPRFAGRVQGYAADLRRPRLGLDASTWGHLAQVCDLVLHNGALVNFLFDYRAHRQANVAGTAELLRLAMAHRPVPLHYVSTLAALGGAAGLSDAASAAGLNGAAGLAGAGLRGGRVPEHYEPSRAPAPRSGYSRSKWVAERYLEQARRRGAVVTVLRLGEVMPSEDNGHPNPLALTHLLLSAIHRLGVWPDATIRSDYTPVDYVAARVVAAVRDRAVWGQTLHIFHPDSVCFAEALAVSGAAVARISCRDFLARLREASSQPGQRDLARLAALLPVPSGQDEAALRRALRGLLTDNPALFDKDACRRLERRWRFVDGQPHGPLIAYRSYLGLPAGPAEPGAAAGLAGVPPAHHETGRP
jgi:amino acid adenylation domain-containing protein/thioester reductase-like protein